MIEFVKDTSNSIHVIDGSNLVAVLYAVDGEYVLDSISSDSYLTLDELRQIVDKLDELNNCGRI